MLQWSGSFHHNLEGCNYLGIRSLGRYKVRGELGRGTMGVVYRGYDPVLDREIVAPKWRHAGEPVVEERPSGEHVAATVDVLALELFR